MMCYCILRRNLAFPIRLYCPDQVNRGILSWWLICVYVPTGLAWGNGQQCEYKVVEGKRQPAGRLPLSKMVGEPFP